MTCQKKKKNWQRTRSSNEPGIAEAHHAIGLCYYFGLGVQVNYDQAFKHFTTSTEFGYTVAHNELGVMYLLGIQLFKTHQNMMIEIVFKKQIKKEKEWLQMNL